MNVKNKIVFVADKTGTYTTSPYVAETTTGINFLNKLILKTPSFDLMEDVKKRFGVEFHPNTPITKIGDKLKEIGYVKDITQASTAIRQTDNDRKESVRKVEEATRKEKTVGIQIAPSKASPN